MALKGLSGGYATEKGRARIRRQKTLRALMTTLLVLTIVFMGAGLAYAWYTSQKSPDVVTPAPPKPATKKISTSPVVDPKTPVGVSVTVLTSPIKAGSNASSTVKTKPLAACSIKVEYDKKPSTDGGLVPKSADEYGVATWAWTVEQGRPAGTWPVDVTCARDGKSGYVRGDLVIE